MGDDSLDSDSLDMLAEIVILFNCIHRRGMDGEAELTAQITELRAKVEMQEEMLRRIMYAVEGRAYDAYTQKRTEGVGSHSQEGSRTR